MAKGNKTILALQGHSSRGKTATLNYLIKKLAAEPDANPTISEKDKWEDCWANVYYHGKKIGLLTLGDYESYLKTQLAELEKFDPDLYVCACRTKGQTVDFLEKESKSLFLVGKWYVYDELNSVDNKIMERLQDFTNEQQAYDLIELIDKILFGFPD